MTVSFFPEDVAERRARIAALTREGVSALEISSVLGVTQRSVQRARQEMGISRERATPLTADEMYVAAQLLDDGCSYNEVAKTLGRCARTIIKRFPGRGWPPDAGPRLGAFNRWMKQKGGARL